MTQRRWEARAKAVTQVDLITVANTWAQNDTATLTINGVDLVITIGTLVTTVQVATTIKEAINGTTLTDTSASVSPTIAQGGGQAIGEFAEVVATITSGSTSVVVVTARTHGKPFTLTVTENTVGTGTATRSGSVTCTGPNFFDNADNWSGSTVPITGDDAVFDVGDTPLLYNLDQNGITLASLTITNGYTGDIGLPERNEDNGSLPYNEYRTKKLMISATVLTIGGGEGKGSARIRLNLGTAQTTAFINHNGARALEAYPTIQIIGTHASNAITVSRGDVGIADMAGEAATVTTLRVGYIDNVTGDAKVLVGSGATLNTVNQSGGFLDVECAIATAYVGTAGECVINGSGAVASLTVRGSCTVRFSTTGTLGGNPIVSGNGFLDFGQDLRTKTVTNPLEIYGEDAKVSDPFKVVTSLVLDWNEGEANLGNFALGSNVRLTRGTPA